MNRPMMDYRMMRDMARGRRRMNVVGQRTDMAMDGRNPYGSRGGYVVSGRRRMDRGREDYELHNPEHDSRRGVDYGTGEYNPRDSIYNRELYGYYGDTPFEIRRSYPMRDYNMDYGRGGRRDYGYDYNYSRDYGMDFGHGYKLDKEELEEWTHHLMKDMDEKAKEMLKKEKIMKKAEEMGIKFEHFTPEEYYATVVMMYSDHCDSFGSASVETYMRMAKDFLMDKDVAVKYGEKLATYYDAIVMGE